MCGGTIADAAGINVMSGLSPRVRGNPRMICIAAKPFGSIPACAGEPGRLPPAPGIRRVYPRVCGGTDNSPAQWRPQCGLSPRVRGNQTADAAAHLAEGSIPACAGEPIPAGLYGKVFPVYPRVCGGTRRF